MGPEVAVPYEDLSSTYTGGSGYFNDRYLSQKTGELALLKTVLFQRLYANPTTETNYMKWSAYYRFNPAGKTRLMYNLLPGIVDFLQSPAHLCINSRIKGLKACTDGAKPATGCASANTNKLPNPVYADGTDLTAFWLAPPAIDMSHALTTTLRANSKLHGNTGDWLAIHERMTPAGLARAGYGLCEPGADSHTAFRVCFCRPQFSEARSLKPEI